MTAGEGGERLVASGGRTVWLYNRAAVIDRMLALVVDEAKWLPLAMAIAAVAVGMLVARRPTGERVHLLMAGMNLFAGVMLGVMGTGHVLAVTTKLLQGTLEGSPAVLYPIGVAVLVPSSLMVAHTRAILADGGARTMLFNGWMAVTLAALGLHNLPLVAPLLLNIGYRLHRRRAVGWAIVSVAVVLNTGLFIGALIFMASGQSFEQFSGME
jgi:hypothetical protein